MMTRKEKSEQKTMCNRAYAISEQISAEYAQKTYVDDFETFRFLMYMLEIRKSEIDKLEERINELEQKENARNNA